MFNIMGRDPQPSIESLSTNCTGVNYIDLHKVYDKLIDKL